MAGGSRGKEGIGKAGQGTSPRSPPLPTSPRPRHLAWYPSTHAHAPPSSPRPPLSLPPPPTQAPSRQGYPAGAYDLFQGQGRQLGGCGGASECTVRDGGFMVAQPHLHAWGGWGEGTRAAQHLRGRRMNVRTEDEPA